MTPTTRTTSWLLRRNSSWRSWQRTRKRMENAVSAGLPLNACPTQRILTFLNGIRSLVHAQAPTCLRAVQTMWSDTKQHPCLDLRLNQEKMKKEVALLQKQLEAKERKMVELMKNAGSMPALKQHYDRVLAELEAQRDTLVAERKALMEVGLGCRPRHLLSTCS